ncbi:hypothetical protein ABZ897_42975 [Nonomuraea sp. NPDC046802]|uniref:hypothetical protein n=1 Tax=Nonomuraea sp. NPDC046802 TaxID=3154919 RepID=UPI0033F0BEE7
MLDPMHTGEQLYYLAEYTTEISRTTEDGTTPPTTTVIVSHMPSLTILGRQPFTVRRGAPYAEREEDVEFLHVRDQDDNTFWIVDRPAKRNEMQLGRQEFSKEGRIFTYHPANEWGAFRGYGDLDDLKAALGDEETRQTRYDGHGALLARVHEVIGDDWPFDTRPDYKLADPSVHVYTRDQYERACAAAGLEPLDDERCAKGIGWAPLCGGETAIMRMTAQTLAGRRASGIKAEITWRLARGCEAAEVAVGIGSYTRDQYERAGAIIGIPALSDGGCVAAVEHRMSRIVGDLIVIDPRIPDDDLSIDMAERRVDAMEQEARSAGHRCDECGAVIVGSAMSARVGLACRVVCFDAMADRPGRYATRTRN